MLELLLELKKLDRNGIAGIDLKIVPRETGGRALYLYCACAGRRTLRLLKARMMLGNLGKRMKEGRVK